MITKEDAIAILEADDTEVLEIMNATYIIRHHHFGKKVKLNMIINTKSDYVLKIVDIAHSLLFQKHRLINMHG